MISRGGSSVQSTHRNWSARSIAALPIALMLALGGCGASPDSDDSRGKVTVVVGMYPLEYIITEVGKDLVDVENLTAPGQEPHDLELSPTAVARVVEADLTVYEAGFQPAVDDAVVNAPARRSFDVAHVVPLVSREEADGHDHGEEGDHAEGDDEGAATNLDPHVWLNPLHMITIAEAIADELASIDPANAETYRTNAEALIVDLNALDVQFSEGLASCERDTFITAHAAFGYLADQYSLTQIGISGLSPDEEPSPARIAEIQEEARRHGVTTIFFETLVSPKLAETIAADLGLETDVLDPLEGITDQSRGTDYPSVMRSNLQALVAANGCS